MKGITIKNFLAGLIGAEMILSSIFSREQLFVMLNHGKIFIFSDRLTCDVKKDANVILQFPLFQGSGTGI